MIVIATKRELEAPSTDVLLVERPHPDIVADVEGVLSFPYLYDVAAQDEGCACGFKLYCEAAHTYMQEVPADEAAEIVASDRAMFERRERLIDFLRAEVEASGEIELFVTIYDPDNRLLKHDPLPERRIAPESLYDETLEGPVLLRIGVEHAGGLP